MLSPRFEVRLSPYAISYQLLFPIEICFTNDERGFMAPRVVPESLHTLLIAAPKAACECLGFRTYWEREVDRLSSEGVGVYP